MAVNRWLHVMLSALLFALVCSASADVQRVDLLLGLGGFEQGSDFRWQSGYSGSDYDWSANCDWVGPVGTSGWRGGYNLCRPDAAVATGWKRLSGETINPGLNQVYKLVDGQGVSGSRAQYIALRNCNGSAYTIIRHDRLVYPSLANEPKPGDTIVFRIDSVRMTGLDALSAGSVVIPSIELQVISRSGGETFSTPVVPGKTSTAVEVSAVLPSDVTEITAGFKLDINANLTSKELGAYLDGAHLYIKRAATPSEYATWEIPAVGRRRIKACLDAFAPFRHDIYEAARDHDILITGEEYGWLVPMLRAINPKIVILVYKASHIYKQGTDDKDEWYQTCGVGYAYAAANHSEWLYTDGKGGFITKPVYSRSYFTHIENPDYQEMWTRNVNKVVSTHGFDGVWIDELNEFKSPVPIPLPACQQFAHYVIPRLRTAGSASMRNGIMNFTSGQGLALNNPFFNKELPYNSTSFSPNTPDLVSDRFFQEMAFFKNSWDSAKGKYSTNTYNADFWWGQIQDMDLLLAWNSTRLPSNRKKYMTLYSMGVNSATDTRDGIDGWMQFALASYLLAQNEYTSFGSMDIDDYSKIGDFSITKRLGAPDGQHFANADDTYCRCRRYRATDDGGMGGVVVVNGNDTVSGKYTLDFDAEDEFGNVYAAGTKIMLKAHTGRIFIQSQLLDVTLKVPVENVAPGQTIDVTVEYINQSSSQVKDVIVRAQVPDQLEYVAGSAEKTGGRYYADTKMVVWAINSLIAQGKGSRTFKAKVK